MVNGTDATHDGTMLADQATLRKLDGGTEGKDITCSFVVSNRGDGLQETRVGGIAVEGWMVVSTRLQSALSPSLLKPMKDGRCIFMSSVSSTIYLLYISICP